MPVFVHKLLDTAAWTMAIPTAYSAFHILLAISGISAAWFSARLLRRCTERTFYRILIGCGLFLALSELLKQLFLYDIVFHYYEWWYFPFQLCSTPMYFCLILMFFYPSATRKDAESGNIIGGKTNHSPACKSTCKSILVYLQVFSLLGGIMALVFPEGFLTPYWVLTLHGFLWHFMLIFISRLITETGHGSQTFHDYSYSLPVLFSCLLIATAINILAHPYGPADMFYITPYMPSEQPIIHQFATAYGILPGILLYITAILVGGAVSQAVSLMHKKF